jgi:anti-anti-sigma factor
MVVTVSERHGITVAQVVGELSEPDARELADTLRAAVPNAATGLVVDLTEVTHLDSTGVHLLFEIARRLGRRQQQLRVVAAPDSVVDDIVSLTDLGSYAPIDRDLGEALQRLQSSAA